MNATKRTALKCAECSCVFVPKPASTGFCRAKCRQAWHKRQVTRAARMYPVAMTWRASRNRKGDAEAGRLAMVEMCRLMDADAAEDRAAGRTPVADIGKRRLRRDGAISRT